MLPRYVLLFSPLVNAWTFRYTNGTDETIITRGNAERNCTIANIAAEKLFTFDPEGTNQCVSIYRDETCDSMGGYSCTSWRKNASRTFMAFDIMPENLIIAKSQTSTMASTSSATSTSASASTSTASSTSVFSAASSPTVTPSDTVVTTANTGSSTALSGGAIAGVVIGVVAAVVIIVGLLVFFVKRKNNQNASTATGSYGPHEADATGFSMSGTTIKEPLVSVGVRPAPGSRLVELKGDEGSTELGSSPISELDGGAHRSGHV